MPKYITVKEEIFDELTTELADARRWLACLERVGLYNWEKIDEALVLYESDAEIKKTSSCKDVTVSGLSESSGDDLE